MKKLLLFTALAAACTTAAAQEFDEGDRRIDFSIGIGMIARDGDSSTTFDQHFGMEWGVGRIGNKVTVGLGFSVNNSYGPYDGAIAGTYDYYYTQYYSTGSGSGLNTKQHHRKGSGWADASLTREDINAQFTVSFHYSPMAKLDVYTTVGAGVGVMNICLGKTSNETNFSSSSVNYSNTAGMKSSYSYNDLDHVVWDGLKSKVVPAISVYAGATYYFNDRWGLEAQVGLLSANIKDKKKGYPNSYSIFSVGASYKF